MTGVIEPGTNVAGYTVQSVIAHGGMGVVYLARQERPSREVALKLIAPERASDPAYRERFLRESELLAGLEHPNIVPIHAAGEWEGQLFLAMRYIRGETLADRVVRHPSLTPAESLRMLSPIADALTAAHEEGVVHRDVKPANILISARGHVYLSDFGLTKRTGSDPSLTRPGTALGTEGYMAPEQFTGRVDPEFVTRIDIYALGCVLHACLTGVEPYPRDSYEASLWAHVFSPPPSLVDRAPSLANLDPIIARAMAKDPADRYPAANAMMADLAIAIAAAPPEVEPPPVPSAPARRPVTEPTTVGPPAVPTPAAEPTGIARPSDTPTRMEVPGTIAILPAPSGRAGGQRPAAWSLPGDARSRLRAGVAGILVVTGVILFAFLTGMGRAPAGGTAQVSASAASITVRPATPVPTPTPIDPVANLVARVPTTASGCTQVLGPSEAADVAVQCTATNADGDINVQYAQFADAATLQAAWGEHLAASSQVPGAGSCPTTTGEGAWNFQADPDTIERGRLFCYVSETSESVVEWTYVDETTWTLAWRPGTDLTAIHEVFASGDLDLIGTAGD